MNFLIQAIAAQIARRVESGSTKGAWIGAVVGAILLGGLGAWGWQSGVTGYMGFAFTLAGLLAGSIGGALAGAGCGPTDRLITSDTQTSIRLTDYNRQLVYVVPLVICAVFGGLCLRLIVLDYADPKMEADDLNALKLVVAVCVLGCLGCAVFLPTRVLSVTLAEEIYVNKLLSHSTYDYADVLDWGFMGDVAPGKGIEPEGSYKFFLKLPGREVELPVNGEQLLELKEVLDGFAPQEHVDE
ncbi:MAG: hypothetical protein AAGA25_11580 [Planctomycetota bacterium]